jgi:hypothetical protein
MSQDCVEGNADLSLDRARSVNRRCEEFEAAWRAGERPGIASYLNSSNPCEHSACSAADGRPRSSSP